MLVLLSFLSLTISIGISFTSMFPRVFSMPTSILDDSSDVTLHAPSLLEIMTIWDWIEVEWPIGWSCGKNGSDLSQDAGLSEMLSVSDGQGLWALSVSSSESLTPMLDVCWVGVLLQGSSSDSDLSFVQVSEASEYSTSCYCGIGLLRSWLYLSCKKYPPVLDFPMTK